MGGGFAYKEPAYSSAYFGTGAPVEASSNSVSTPKYVAPCRIPTDGSLDGSAIGGPHLRGYCPPRSANVHLSSEDS